MKRGRKRGQCVGGQTGLRKPNKFHEVECAVCGRKFGTRGPNVKYCVECREEVRRLQVNAFGKLRDLPADERKKAHAQAKRDIIAQLRAGAVVARRKRGGQRLPKHPCPRCGTPVAKTEYCYECRESGMDHVHRLTGRTNGWDRKRPQAGGNAPQAGHFHDADDMGAVTGRNGGTAGGDPRTPHGRNGAGGGNPHGQSGAEGGQNGANGGNWAETGRKRHAIKGGWRGRPVMGGGGVTAKNYVQNATRTEFAKPLTRCERYDMQSGRVKH